MTEQNPRSHRRLKETAVKAVGAFAGSSVRVLYELGDHFVTNHSAFSSVGIDTAVAAFGGALGAEVTQLTESDAVTIYSRYNAQVPDKKATSKVRNILQGMTVVGYGLASTIVTPGDPRINNAVNAASTLAGVVTSRLIIRRKSSS